MVNASILKPVRCIVEAVRQCASQGNSAMLASVFFPAPHPRRQPVLVGVWTQKTTINTVAAVGSNAPVDNPANRVFAVVPLTALPVTNNALTLRPIALTAAVVATPALRVNAVSTEAARSPVHCKPRQPAMEPASTLETIALIVVAVEMPASPVNSAPMEFVRSPVRWVLLAVEHVV
jgi:hypothetical protein